MSSRGIGFWISWVVIALAAVLYAYGVWAAVGNVLVLPEFAARLGLKVSALGWFWLTVQIALPLLIAGVALLLGRKRAVHVRALLFAAGVAVVAVLSIDITHSVPQISYFG